MTERGADAAWLDTPALVVDVFAGGVWVETLQQASCHGCTGRTSCGMGLLSRWRSHPRLQIATPGTYQVGDIVRVRIPVRGFLSAALTVYAWPLGLALVSGGVAETLSTPGHVIVPLVFVGGLLFGVCIARWIGWRWSHRYRPHLLVDKAST
ncbi:SoxR reducing system RseC family protein [Modicisalibacter luteus]|uniref:SoxR reducing system RseC family protein n=1 Tax=Modicisalibacter luteus TaxID=453962 RepID=A0ABV7M4E0_9GAMM|nr:SoxR reducing system RseC family protein [Halomonas lutea]GHA89373.1 hypothetical protein GCM10007159_08620 [Halomonas lutea]